ncbi:MAG: TlpA family protein disulfide reductase [Bacteroidales bacterium]|nr:TlpA family protein disulfide reductase [Bacteroidales bacterium]
MKKIFLIIMAVATAAAATAQKATVAITFNGLEAGTAITVGQVQGNNLTHTETLTPNAKGQLTLSRVLADPTVLILETPKEQGAIFHLMLMPKEKITLTVDYMPTLRMFNILSVKGSNNMKVYKEFTNLMVRSRLMAAGTPYEATPFEQSLDSLLSANASVLMSAFLTTYFDQVFEQHTTLYKKVRDALIGQWPENEYVKYLDHKLRSSILPGMEAPDIVLPDRDGNTRSLSSLRGKVVLVDFWASWCRPCRMENPNVVRLYQQYHDRGFEIFSVSLDNNRDAWIRAINDDHLSWPNHVSDLRGWSSAGGRLYGIQSIPATVLVAPDGSILARNLRGQELENKLKEIFAQ